MGGQQDEINGCYYWVAVWIEVQVGMLFQIGNGHGQGGIREFVYDADGPAS